MRSLKFHFTSQAKEQSARSDRKPVFCDGKSMTTQVVCSRESEITDFPSLTQGLHSNPQNRSRLTFLRLVSDLSLTVTVSAFTSGRKLPRLFLERRRPRARSSHARPKRLSRFELCEGKKKLHAHAHRLTQRFDVWSYSKLKWTGFSKRILLCTLMITDFIEFNGGLHLAPPRARSLVAAHLFLWCRQSWSAFLAWIQDCLHHRKRWAATKDRGGASNSHDEARH